MNLTMDPRACHGLKENIMGSFVQCICETTESTVILDFLEESNIFSLPSYVETCYENEFDEGFFFQCNFLANLFKGKQHPQVK